jgi:ferredoxin
MAGKVLSTAAFDTLIPLLSSLGYTVIGPSLRDGTIGFAELENSADLPIGWTDEQEAGSYRVTQRTDDAYFGYQVGPRTLRRFLSPPSQTLFTIEYRNDGLAFVQQPLPDTRYAYFGVRSCELAAVAVQDKVLASTSGPDPSYVRARSQSFTVGVNCSEAGATCFCASMGTGPQCTTGYDLVITEALFGARHEFMIEATTDAGASVLDRLDGRAMTAVDASEVQSITAQAASQMGRSMPADEAYDLLADNLDHPIWESIAERCLSCANCTLVCPTCFCSTTEDVTDLAGTATRQRRWDSCFDLEFTNLHGRPVRSSTAARYRQWMTHKLAYWYDQFGTSGCVGCGRCIAWCPVGIDITHEVARLRKDAEVMA